MTSKNVNENAPWSSMRGNLKNTGVSKNLNFTEDMMRSTDVTYFRTGNAIFSTPIVGMDDVIYVGSADHKIYAFNPHNNKTLWSFQAGEIIDSAGTIGSDGTIYIAAGDGKIYAFQDNGESKVIYDILKDRKKEHFTLSTNWWFEANIVFGPDGYLYVANDDFHLYKMTTEGKVIWSFRTGFMVWSASSFGTDGNSVYIAGFDHYLYALDRETGKLKWRTDLKGSLVSSTAVGDNGLLIQGSFNGKMYGIKESDGEIIWEFDTGNHIYASPAISPDNKIYFGSTNGLFYKLDGDSGELQWSYYIGDAIRSSCSIGPDPERKHDYLIYFGGGDGYIYVLDPNGKLRWSYNTLDQAISTDYPNINASIALGNAGLAIASSTGDVIWLPYDHYTLENATGVSVGEVFDSNLIGPFWHYLSPGGKFDRNPINKSIDINPVNILSIRLLYHEGTNVSPVIISPSSIQIKSKPYFEFRYELQSDNCTLYIIPNEILEADTSYNFEIHVEFKLKSGKTRVYDTNISILTKKASNSTKLVENKGKLYEITHMAVPQPSIVPSLDQIGLASLTIPFSIVDIDEKNNKFIVWAVQKFTGEGVPQKRIVYYAFKGSFNGDYFVIESQNCLFEITAFSLPLDKFRVAGLIKPDGTVESGGSLMIEKRLGTKLIPLIKEMGSSNPLTLKVMWGYIKDIGLIKFLKALFPFLKSLLRQFKKGMMKNWGLINHEKKLIGVGTFRMEPIVDKSEETLNKVKVVEFNYNQKRNLIYAEVSIPSTFNKWDAILGVMIIDKETLEPLPLNYTALSNLKYFAEKTEITLKLPKKTLQINREYEIILLFDLYTLDRIKLELNHI